MARPSAPLDVTAEDAFSLVTFECTQPATEEHDVHVVGDVPALGCWDVAKSVPLSRGEGNLRTSAPISFVRGVPLQYKYVLCAAGHLVRWENIAGNRMLVPERAELSVVDELDNASHSAELPTLLPPPPPPPPPPPLAPEAVALAGFHTAGAPQPPAAADSAVLVVTYILPLIISKTSAGTRSVRGSRDPRCASAWQRQRQRLTPSSRAGATHCRQAGRLSGTRTQSQRRSSRT
jgi:hypothetical protein